MPCFAKILGRLHTVSNELKWCIPWCRPYKPFWCCGSPVNIADLWIKYCNTENQFILNSLKYNSNTVVFVSIYNSINMAQSQNAKVICNKQPNVYNLFYMTSTSMLRKKCTETLFEDRFNSIVSYYLLGEQLLTEVYAFLNRMLLLARWSIWGVRHTVLL